MKEITRSTAAVDVDEFWLRSKLKACKAANSDWSLSLKFKAIIQLFIDWYLGPETMSNRNAERDYFELKCIWCEIFPFKFP